eukprot:s2714_g4.t1
MDDEDTLPMDDPGPSEGETPAVIPDDEPDLDLELPAEDEGMLSAGPCCKKGCYAAFLDDPDKNQAVIEWRAMLDLKGVDDRRTFLYDMLMRMYKDTMSMFTSSSYFLIKGLWDGRKERSVRDHPASDRASAFFRSAWCGEDIGSTEAESFAESGHTPAGAAAVSCHTKEVRQDQWSSFMLARAVPEHLFAGARLSQWREQAKTADEKLAVAQQKDEHLRGVFADRAVARRLMSASHNVTAEASTSLIYAIIDGMDQAKFRIPRNVMNSKEFCSDYRPSAHMIGLYVPGIAECYFLTESDLKKDSSTNLTCLSRGLFLLKKILASRNLPLPENLVIQADNTSRETRNSIGLQYGAWLVGQQAFRNVDILFYRDFQQHLLQMQPGGGRELHVEIVDASWDWKQFFDTSGMIFKGITINEQQEEVVHAFRFCKRAGLEHYEGSAVRLNSL